MSIAAHRFRFLTDLWRRDWLTALSVAALLTLLLLGILGPHLPIGDAAKLAAGPRLSPPSWRFPFGTDELGRSFLPRVVIGIRSTFLLSAAAVAVTALIGTLIGMVAGYCRGLADEVVARLADILFSFPALLVGLLIAAALGPGRISAISVIAIVVLPLFVRVVRSVTLTLTGRGFIVAAEVAGASTLRILSVHILPNIAGAVVVQLTYALSIGMIIESALSSSVWASSRPTPRWVRCCAKPAFTSPLRHGSRSPRASCFRSRSCRSIWSATPCATGSSR